GRLLQAGGPARSGVDPRSEDDGEGRAGGGEPGHGRRLDRDQPLRAAEGRRSIRVVLVYNRRSMSTAASAPVYKRILLKLSGEALMGGQNYGIDPAVATQIAREIGEIQSMGVQTAIVIG